MTQAQDEARRRNALLSTGPKTEEGKTTSRLNALKHGLRSQIFGDESPITIPDSPSLPAERGPGGLSADLSSVALAKEEALAKAGEVDRITENAIYTHLLDDLIRHYAPQNPLEELLIKRIALLSWRLQRIELAEQNAIASYPGTEFALPPAGAMERILKYERTMDRELHRTIYRLQKMIASRGTKQSEQTEEPEDTEIPQQD